MTDANQWQWLIDFCISHKDTSGKSDPFRMLPSMTGEPWVEYRAVAMLLNQESKTIENQVVKLRIPRHPVFTGLIQITSFERLQVSGD